MFRDDYMMRMVHEMVRAVIKLIFGIDEEHPEDMVITNEHAAKMFQEMKALADDGRFNEAENLLYERMDRDNKYDLQAALMFYEYLNQMDGDVLESHDYSKEEVKEGIQNILEEFGYDSLKEMF